MSTFLRVQPLYFPADYTFRQTGVGAQPLLAEKCWAIVVVKKNCGKDDMPRNVLLPCFYYIVNSFRKTFERMMCQNLSHLILSLCV